MNNGNRVGSRNGGFHSYRRFSQPTLAHSHSPATKMSMELPDHLNQAIAANVEDSQSTIQEQDRFMSITNLIRIMRRILPPHAKISNDSKLTIQECVSEFISFVTGEANKHCQHDQRKTITAEDLLWAMNNFGFDDYIEPLTLYLHRYRENNGGEHESPRGEPLLLRRSMVNPTSGCIAPYHFVYPPPMGNGYMQGDVSNESTSQCAVTAVDSEVDSPAKEGME